MRVALFTNNYMPFRGGVTTAVETLRRGLQELGHGVWVFAPASLMETDGIRPGFVVIGEPTRMRVYRGHRGRLELMAHARGKSCHAAQPHLGDNAIYKMTPVIDGVKFLADRLAVDPFLGKGSIAVTSVSGRGVGMDVVRQGIEALRGSLEIDSRSGEGTTVTVRMPLTLAIIEGLLMSVGGRCFVLPLAAVEECIELSRADVAKSHGRDIVEVRGHAIPYVRLRERFAIGGEPPEIEQIVISDVEGSRVGFAVDRVVGELQTVIKSLGRVYRNVDGVSGSTILGDGTVALILDAPRIVRGVELDERASLR